MFGVIYPNRWLIWAVVISLVTAMLLYWAIALYTIELRWDPASDSISDALRNFKKMRLEGGGISGWKTYRDNEYGFEFQYPDDWTTTSISGNTFLQGIQLVFKEDRGICWASSPQAGVSCSYPIVIHGSILDKSILSGSRDVFQSFRDYINAINNQHVGGFLNEVYQVTTMDGANVAYREYRSKSYKNFDTTVIPERIDLEYIIELSEDEVLNIELRSEVAYEASARTALQRFISTFKFFEPVDALGRKTYRNEEFGFEFKYPVDWNSSLLSNGIQISQPSKYGSNENDYCRLAGFGCTFPDKAVIGILAGHDRGATFETILKNHLYSGLLVSAKPEVKNIHIDERRAVHMTIPVPMGESIFIDGGDGKFFEISASYGPESKEKVLKTLGVILDTVKFFE